MFAESRSEISLPEECVLPLFPLPDLVIFPGALQPLQIFEPRYRQLIRDLLDNSGQLVVGTVIGASRRELRGAPDVRVVAGLCRLEQYQKLRDGRFLILLRGEGRVLIREVASDRLYRRVRVALLADTAESSTRAEVYRHDLRDAVLERASDDFELPDELSVSTLTDLLLVHLKLEPSRLHEIYARTKLDERVREALSAHQEAARE